MSVVAEQIRPTLSLQDKIVNLVESIEFGQEQDLLIAGCQKGWGDATLLDLTGIDHTESITIEGPRPSSYITETELKRLNQSVTFLRKHEQECGKDHRPLFYGTTIWDRFRDFPSDYTKVLLDQFQNYINSSQDHA